MEFTDANLNSSDAVRGYNTNPSNDVLKKNSVPAIGMPRRNQAFSGDVGGNNIGNANITNYNATTQGSIFGRSGRYDELGTGRKVFGNPTQGNTQLGIKTNQAVPDCSPRTMYIAVTATTDQASLRMDL